ncbi:MAG: hypothetical protein U0Q18_36300 [Bryobacteraceae bacterium]
MRLRLCVILALLLAGCGRLQRSPETLLPPVVDQVWQRRQVRETSPSPARAKRAYEAAYTGPGSLTAVVYELDSSAAALDLAQRWKPAADTVFFCEQNYFALVKWDRSDRKALSGFVRGLQHVLAPARGASGPQSQ